MEKYLKILIIILVVNSFVYSQKNDFEWNDTTLTIGQIKEIQLLFNFDGPCSTRPCYRFNNNGVAIDSFVNFMNRNPNIKIEIGVHSDQRGNKKYSNSLSNKRAKGIRDEFVINGIDPKRMTYRGYGDSKPIITKGEIKSIKSEREKEIAYRKNRRIEIKLTEINTNSSIKTIENPSKIRIVSKLEVIDETLGANINYCSHEIKTFKEMDKFDCSFKIDSIEYNLRSKYIFNNRGELISYWSYKSEGPLVYEKEDFNNDKKFFEYIDGKSLVIEISQNKVIESNHSFEIEKILEEQKMIFIKPNKKDNTGIRIIYLYEKK